MLSVVCVVNMVGDLFLFIKIFIFLFLFTMTFSVPKSIYEWSLRIIDLIGNIILDYLKKTVHNILTITTDIQGGGL